MGLTWLSTCQFPPLLALGVPQEVVGLGLTQECQLLWKFGQHCWTRRRHHAGREVLFLTVCRDDIYFELAMHSLSVCLADVLAPLAKADTNA